MASVKGIFKGDWIWYAALFIIAMIPLFGFLDTLAIRLWDEARNAINAYEMYKSGYSIVTTYRGDPDLWNTKPPLLIWLMVTSMKAFGVNEMALRLPSALAAFITAIVVFRFMRKELDSPLAGLIAVIVLITSFGYMDFHAARSADFDSLLTLFSTLLALSFYRYVKQNSDKALFFGFLFMAFAVLTKSIAGLLITPAILAYLIYTKTFLKSFKSKYLYLGFLLLVVLVGGYYTLREMLSPGYLSVIAENELGGRYLKVNEGHKGNFWYYYNFIVSYHFTYWAPLMLGGWLVSLFHKNQKIRDVGVFCTFMILGYFLVVSLGKSKLEWYDVPLYPFFAILTSIFIWFIAELIRDFAPIKHLLTKNVLPAIFVFFICIQPYQDIIGITYKPLEYPWNKPVFEMSYYLRKAIHNKMNIDGYYIMSRNKTFDKEFYLMLLKDKGQNVAFIAPEEVKPGMRIITDDWEMQVYAESELHTEVIEQHGSVKIYSVIPVLTNDTTTITP